MAAGWFLIGKSFSLIHRLEDGVEKKPRGSSCATQSLLQTSDMLNQLAILSCDNSGYTQKQHSSGKTRVLSPQKCQDGFKSDHKLPSHWAVVSPSSTTPTLYSGDVFQMHLFVLRDFNSLVKSKHYVRKKFGGSFLWPLQISFQEIKLHMIFLC